MSFSTLCHERFSARKYLDKKVEEEKIAAILEAGRVAPTAKTISRNASTCSKAKRLCKR